ncbi:hypothetical protein I2I05_15410 [Hymenobacter sp. BT683]|uniref:Zinc-finger domain-containing protein n=1 Tax=Hymenobacter jeongseonensis TaxID=2791027 RepID=A0ABS0IL89_9BACT|nr:hypothetical protein [Hymenobacter jeongseonensis]MBF9238789.1 hypothetical protein [Hymenobacter jeongseonensis]
MDQSATTKTNSSAPVAATPDNGTDCERVNTVLDQLIEGQPVTAEDEDYLYDHANDCSPCFDDIEKQRIFIGFLNKGLSRRPSPASLQESILARVSAEMA